MFIIKNLLKLLFSGAIYVIAVYYTLGFVYTECSPMYRDYVVSIASLAILLVTAKLLGSKK